jgi:Xaa-Pro dipeptidase
MAMIANLGVHMGMGAVLGSPGQLPVLSLTERDRRWTLANELMDSRGLDGLLVYGDKIDGMGQPFVGPDNWFTNDRPGSVVIMPRGEQPYALAMLHIAAGAHMDAARRGDAAWIPPGRVFAGGTHTTQGGGRTSTAIAEVLQHAGLASGRVGVIGLEPFGGMAPEGLIPHATFVGLQTRCPELQMEPIGRDWLLLMLPKSAEELALLEVACRAGESMSEAMLATVVPGASENDIYGAVMEACFAAGAVTHWMILVRAAGGRSVGWGPPAWTYRAQPPGQVASGDVVYAELFPAYGMIEAQQQLTIVVGEPSAELESAAAGARDAYQAGIAALKPGGRFGDVADAMSAAVQAAGGWQLTPHLHTLSPNAAVGGCGFPPWLPEAEAYGNPGRLETQGAELPLLTGMTFAMQANCSIGYTRVNIGGTVALTAHGVREYNTLPNDLHRS